MPVAAVNGIDINYRLEGPDGAGTIVLINGLADDLETWVFQMDDLLAAGYRVLRFDNRGVGASSMPEGPYTTALMASDARALVEEVGIDDFHLVGTSMGGMIAQEFAIDHPQGLRSLVLSSTYAAPGPFCSRMFAIWADMAPVNGVPLIMRDVTLWAFTVPFFEEREDELKEFETGMAELSQSTEAYLAQLSSIQTHDTTGRVGGISVPTLVMAGEKDILIPVVLSERLQQAIPGAEWVTTPGGHASLWEHPAAFNRAVLDFIGRHQAR